MAEWSKALDLGSSLYGGVGSNPTAASCGFNQGWEALRVLEKSLKISLAATRSAKDMRVIQDALSSPTDEFLLAKAG